MSEATDAAKEEGGEEEKQGGGSRKFLILAGLGLLLLLGGGGAAAYFLGFFGGAAHAEAEDAAADEARSTSHEGETAVPGEHEGGAAGEGEAASEPAVVFVELPDVLVNLKSTGRRMRYLKLKVALEVTDEAVAERIRALTPRVMDSLQLYLRALSVEDLRGAVGMERLKEELLARVNRAVRPDRAEDVLFKEILVQ